MDWWISGFKWKCEEDEEAEAEKEEYWLNR